MSRPAYEKNRATTTKQKRLNGYKKELQNNSFLSCISLLIKLAMFENWDRSSSGKVLGHGLDDPVSIPSCREWRFLFTLGVKRTSVGLSSLPLSIAVALNMRKLAPTSPVDL